MLHARMLIPFIGVTGSQDHIHHTSYFNQHYGGEALTLLNTLASLLVCLPLCQALLIILTLPLRSCLCDTIL